MIHLDSLFHLFVTIIRWQVQAMPSPVTICSEHFVDTIRGLKPGAFHDAGAHAIVNKNLNRDWIATKTLGPDILPISFIEWILNTTTF